jgi:hypothetical protein
MQWLWRNNPNIFALVLCTKSSDVAAVPSVLQTAIKVCVEWQWYCNFEHALLEHTLCDSVASPKCRHH